MGLTEHLSGVAVVIGSASGMGRATAISYARYGARGLIVADINEPGVRKTAEEAKRDATHPDFEVLALFTDVRSFESVENVFRKAVEKFGRIDYSVTTAGIWKTQGLLADNPLDNYEDIMNINARGVLYHTKAAIRVMRGQEPQVVQGEDRARVIGRGSIVNVASDSGIDAYPGSIEYNASKAAAISITKTAANEYGPIGIRINAVCPGPIHTPLLERAVAEVPGSRIPTEQSTSFGRIGDPQEVADAILFLTSAVGSFVHGTAMLVDGGAVNNIPGFGNLSLQN